jgi:hypothetical protein
VNANSIFRNKLLNYSNCDILGICETFLRGEEYLCVEGFRFYGSNRKYIHKKATRGSAGVGAFVKKELLHTFDVKIINEEYKSFLYVGKNKFGLINFEKISPNPRVYTCQQGVSSIQLHKSDISKTLL